MLSDAELRELLELNVPESVLSVYLNTEPSQGNADAYRLRLRNMLKEVQLLEDVSAVENYIRNQYDWSGRSIVMFSCAEKGFFRAIPLALAVRDLVQVGDSPSVKPLANLLENFGGYGVVLVDKQGARLFSFHMGELQEQEGYMGEVVKHVKRGGGATVPGMRGGATGKTRAVEETIDRNMKEVSEFAEHFFNEHRVRRVLIGGTEDNISQFKGFLPKARQSLVVGTFPMSMTASHTEVLAKTLEIGSEAERRREKKLVETLVTAAAKKEMAVVGIEATLKSVNESRVKTLVILEGSHVPGYRCADCNTLTTFPGEACNSCGAKTEPLADVLESAVAAVLRTGGEVEIVSSAPELEKSGKVGAILRY